MTDLQRHHFSDLLDTLRAQHGPQLQDAGIPAALAPVRFDAIEPYTLAPLATRLGKLRESLSPGDFEACRCATILDAWEGNWPTISSDAYPPSVQQQFARNAARMLELCRTGEGWAAQSDNVFWKDLAIARRQIFPAGVGIVEAFSGFGLRQGLSLCPVQSARFLKTILRAGGRRGFYQIHTHTPLLGDFNEQAWEECYARIAEMLLRQPHIKGVFRASWFCDPALDSISPWLAYLRRFPLEHGAKLFCVGEDHSGNAFATGRTRRKLFEEGKYTPKAYMIIWPRKPLLRWFRESNA